MTALFCTLCFAAGMLARGSVWRTRAYAAVLDLNEHAAACSHIYAMAKESQSGAVALAVGRLQRNLWKTRDNLADKRPATKQKERAL